MHDHRYWTSYFQRVLVPHLQRLLRTLEERLLPAFGDLSAEASRAQEEAFDRLSHMPVGENFDPAWPAKWRAKRL